MRENSLNGLCVVILTSFFGLTAAGDVLSQLRIPLTRITTIAGSMA